MDNRLESPILKNIKSYRALSRGASVYVREERYYTYIYLRYLFFLMIILGNPRKICVFHILSFVIFTYLCPIRYN